MKEKKNNKSAFSISQIADIHHSHYNHNYKFCKDGPLLKKQFGSLTIEYYNNSVAEYNQKDNDDEYDDKE
ncbi:hypothetical protein F8M41_000297 [Gigaspora margarita]|uniref:Uncharacterized protein n=1 Tax=Gigaspora margarita TaxID=4874 RepID=A0A8H4A920_GIGMA|nr:hypothetical protein F8M41_000297 [Gigaspora margarita]